MLDTLGNAVSTVLLEKGNHWTPWFVRTHFLLSILLIGAVVHGLFFKKKGPR